MHFIYFLISPWCQLKRIKGKRKKSLWCSSLQMSRLTLWLSVGVFVWGFASCSITCPDGSTCSDISTCCKTEYGYGCCQYPKVSLYSHKYNFPLVLLLCFVFLFIVLLVVGFGSQIGNKSYSLCRQCAAQTWPTAVRQGIAVTWWHSCVRNWTSRGWAFPWWRRTLHRNSDTLSSISQRCLQYLPLSSLCQRTKRAWTR